MKLTSYFAAASVLAAFLATPAMAKERGTDMPGRRLPAAAVKQNVPAKSVRPEGQEKDVEGKLSDKAKSLKDKIQLNKDAASRLATCRKEAAAELSEALKTAMLARKEALRTAWETYAAARKAALAAKDRDAAKAALNSYTAARKAAMDDATAARKAAADAHRADLATCKKVPATEPVPVPATSTTP